MTLGDDAALALGLVAAIIGFVLAVILFARIFRQHTTPAASIAWLLAIVFMPYVGVPAYLLFAGRKSRRKAGAKNRLIYAADDPIATIREDQVTARILSAFGMPPPRPGNRIELITDGAVALERLLTLIDGARRSIEIETFIFSDDRTGRLVAEHLAARAEAGVEVMLLVDALGSLPARLWLLRRLSRRGVEVAIFMRMVSLRFRGSTNLRNHRKLALFDSEIAITGGMNIGEPYMGLGPDARRWVDSCMLLEGPIVSDLRSVFADDWHFTTRHRHPLAPAEQHSSNHDEVTQMVVSGPDVHGEPLSDVVVAAMHNARKRVWLVSPYFVPDIDIMRALKTQVRLGNDVCVVLPQRSNHWTADLARNRILRDLGAAGVKLLFHPRRMIHAKLIIVDDDLVVTGSANLDLRSFYYNYEMALLHYSPGIVDEYVNWVTVLMHECRQSTPPKPGFFKRWAEDLCWLLGPLL